MGFEFDDDILNAERMQLQTAFEKRAGDTGTNLYQIDWDLKTLNICDRLFDAEYNDRRINIDLGADWALDGFTKKFGLDEETSLLHLSISKGLAHSDWLWELYFKWLHERVSDHEMEAILDNLMSSLNRPS